MDYKEVKEGEIVIGSPLPWDLYARDGTLLLKKGSVIKTLGHIVVLKAKGLYYDASAASAQPPPEQEKTRGRRNPFEIIKTAHSRAEKFLTNPASAKGFPSEIITLSELIQSACKLDTDASLSTILLVRNEQYSVKHAVDVAIISEVIARHMGWGNSKRASLVAASLTSNISMLRLQNKLHHQLEALNEEQRIKIRNHPQTSAEMLSQLGVKDQLWLDGVTQHHESLDGSGYPAGFQKADISEAARIIAISDFYTAKVTGRGYRPPLSPHQAMQFVFNGQDKRVDLDIAQFFIKVLGIYLPGTYVRLVGGEIAIATHRGNMAHTPIIHVLVGSGNRRFTVPLRRDSSLQKYTIKEVISARDIAIKVNKYELWGY